MDLYEMKTKAEWQELLEEVARETSMTASLTDGEGGILQSAGARFPLCECIRADKEALTFICSQCATAMLAEARVEQKPIIDQCDAGLLRVVIPIVRADAVVGQVTACGVFEDRDDVDPFLVAQQVKSTEEKVEELLASTKQGSAEAVRAVADRLFAQLNG